jgi:hypothetical protein
VRAQRFEAAVGELRASGQGFLVPEDRGVHGVGHSNGALLHLLIGATAAPPNASNVLLSFNNKCAPGERARAPPGARAAQARRVVAPRDAETATVAAQLSCLACLRRPACLAGSARPFLLSPMRSRRAGLAADACA